MKLQPLSPAAPIASQKATRARRLAPLAAGLVLAGLAQSAAAATIVTSYQYVGANFSAGGVDPTTVIDPGPPQEFLPVEGLLGIAPNGTSVDGAEYDGGAAAFVLPAEADHMFTNAQIGVSFDTSNLLTSWTDDGNTPYPASSISFTVTNNGRALHDFSAALGLQLEMFVPSLGLNDIADNEVLVPFLAGNGVGNNDAIFDTGESFVVTFFMYSENEAPAGSVQLLPCSQQCSDPDELFEPGVYIKGSIAPVPVPLPAAAWLLLSGVGLVGATARRRRRA